MSYLRSIIFLAGICAVTAGRVNPKHGVISRSGLDVKSSEGNSNGSKPADAHAAAQQPECGRCGDRVEILVKTLWLSNDKGEIGTIVGERCGLRCKITGTKRFTVRFDDGTELEYREHDVMLAAQNDNVMAFKCETVPTFKAENRAQSCGKSESGDWPFACFSLRNGVFWSCFNATQNVPDCTSTQISQDQREQKDQEETYDGYCVHEGSKQWKSAQTAKELSIRTLAPTPAPTPAQIPDATPAPTKAPTPAPTPAGGSASTTTSSTTTAPSSTTTTKSGAVKHQHGYVAFAVFLLGSVALSM